MYNGNNNGCVPVDPRANANRVMEQSPYRQPPPPLYAGGGFSGHTSQQQNNFNIPQYQQRPAIPLHDRNTPPVLVQQPKRTEPVQLQGRSNSNEENRSPRSDAVLSAVMVQAAEDPPEPELETKYRIKLETPNHLQDLDKTIVQENFLRAINKQVPPSSSELYEEPGCVPFIETAFEIPYENSVNGTDFVLRTSRFTATCPTGVIVKTSDAAVFTNELIAEHVDLRLSCLRFGNIVADGTFLSHFQVTHYGSLPWMQEHFTLNLQYANKRLFFVEIWDEERRNFVKTPSKNKKEEKEFARYFVSGDCDQVERVILSSCYDGHSCVTFRLTLELSCPATIKKFKMKGKPSFNNEPRNRHFTIHRPNGEAGYPRDGVLAESRYLMMEFSLSVLVTTLHQVLSRLYIRTGRPIEFASLPIVDCFIGRSSPYMSWERKTVIQTEIVPFGEGDASFKRELMDKFPDSGDLSAVNQYKQRILTFYLQGVVSRGVVVKDRLLLNKRRYDSFLNNVVAVALEDFEDCIQLMKGFLLFLDTRKRIGGLSDVFLQLRRLQLNGELSLLSPPKQANNDYREILALVCTPTRTIYRGAELQMGNRVSRHYDRDGTDLIRITYRDDDGNFMRPGLLGEYTMKNCIRKRMVDGMEIAGRQYKFLGSSGSQQRDQGAYFMVYHRIQQTLEQLGDFDHVENMYKRLAREGQCLTQSRESNVLLEKAKMVPDVVGGCDSKGKAYTFTDGIGSISVAFAKKLAEDMKLIDCVPSAFQVRVGGIKGMVAVNPKLDEEKEWAEKHCPDQIKDFDYDFLFRPSQHKFFPKQEVLTMEVVKCTMPTPTNLCRPLINLLDQVSGMQSRASQKRIGERIEDLLESVFLKYADAIVDEAKFRNILEDLPTLVDTETLSENKGFTLHQEPFFRSLVAAKMRFDIKKNLAHQTIPILTSFGRTLFGVTDETQMLQYDQIFIRVTKSTRHKFPATNAVTLVVTGPVLLTKNPCNAKGDVRVLWAVDIPELHHHRDVIVFSQHGPRPNPDEMAGSDLDGDEYVAIWDEALLLKMNETPFDFTADKKEEKPDPNKSLHEQRADAIFDLYAKNMIGLLSDAHFIYTDLYGINAPGTDQLIRKVTMALDFGKSGIPPDDLVRVWGKDPETGKLTIPPEIIERRPDFKGSDYHPTYASPRLNGRLHRINNKASGVISTDGCIENLKVSKVLAGGAWRELKQQLGEEVMNRYLEEAKKKRNGFNAKLRAVLDNYCIKTEAELFAGCILDMKNKLAEREEDSGSAYTTAVVAEQLAMDIFMEARKAFFEEFFGGWRQLTTSKNPQYEDENICRRICRWPTTEMKAKALAYYKVCYEAPDPKQPILSFAWLAFDVLAYTQMNFLVKYPTEMPEQETFYRSLAQTFQDYLRQKKKNAYHLFLKKSSHKDFVAPYLSSYLKRYGGLRRVWFILSEWARKCDLLTKGMTEDHLLLILILIGTKSIDTNTPRLFEEIPLDSTTDFNNLVNLEIGYVLVTFLKAMASRKFARLPKISFSHIGREMTFLRGEWVPLHEAARKSFYSLLLNQRAEELLETPKNMEVKEWPPRVIELPEDSDLSILRKTLISITGAEDILLQNARNSRSKTFITAFIRGSQASEEKFREITQVKPNVYAKTSSEMIHQLSRLVHYKIMKYSQGSSGI